MRRAAIAVAILASVCAQAQAQQGTLPATALEDFPHIGIGNGLITVQVYPPGESKRWTYAYDFFGPGKETHQ